MSARLARLIARRPVPTLIVSLAVVLGLAAGLRHLAIDRSIEAVIDRHKSDSPYLDEMKARFGSDEIVVVALVSDRDIFTFETLSKVKALTADLAAIPGVSEVKSLSTANHIEAAEDGLRTDPLFREVPRDAAALAEVRRKALSDDLFRGNIVSPDGKTTALVVYFHPEVDKDADAQFEACLAIEERIAKAEGPERVYASGVPLNKVANSRMARHDVRKLAPILLVANALIIALLYRAARGLVLPVLAIILGALATLGSMGHARIPINTFTNYIPFFVIMLGACYGVHVMSFYYRHAAERKISRDASREERARFMEGMTAEFLEAFAMVVVTTVIGFLSIASSPLPAVWQLGLFTAVGCAILYVVCGVTVPSILALVRPPRRLPPRPDEVRDRRLWLFLAHLGTERGKLAVAVWAAVVAVSVYGATRIETSTNTLEWLSEKHPLRVAETAIAESLGATAVLNLYIRTGADESAIEPENLGRLAKLQAFAASLPETDHCLSILDYLSPLKRALAASGGPVPTELAGSPPHPEVRRAPPPDLAVPTSREEAAELLMIYSKPGDLLRYLDEERATLRMVLRLNDRTSPTLQRVGAALEAEAARLGFPASGVHAASTLKLIADSLDTVAYQLAVSIFTAVGTVLPFLILVVRSLRAGIIAMIPNTVPSVVVFGFMGFFGYKLDLCTSTIASITLGIAVDDTIHFLAMFRRARESGANMVRALELALRDGGRAIFFATGILSISLLFMNLSGYNPVRALGQLASFGFAVCLLCELTLHPALLALFAPRKWKGAALPEDVREAAARAEAEAQAAGLRTSGNWGAHGQAWGQESGSWGTGERPAGGDPSEELDAALLPDRRPEDVGARREGAGSPPPPPPPVARG